MKFFLLMTALALVPASLSAQQRFSCSYGDRGACLGYGDTVCSMGGMCVDQNAACFNKGQCGYEGFTCKSNVTSCINDYNTLTKVYNTLLRKHNDLVDDFNDNLKVAKEMASRLDEIEICLIYASDLETAKDCAQ